MIQGDDVPKKLAYYPEYDQTHWADGEITAIEASRQLDMAIMNFDLVEAKGQVALVRGGFGAEIWVDGKCVALIDLYFRARGFEDHDPDDAGKLHIQIEAPDTPDPLGHVYIHPDHTEMVMERTDVRHYDSGGLWPTLVTRHKVAK